MNEGRGESVAVLDSGLEIVPEEVGVEENEAEGGRDPVSDKERDGVEGEGVQDGEEEQLTEVK